MARDEIVFDGYQPQFICDYERTWVQILLALLGKKTVDMNHEN